MSAQRRPIGTIAFAGAFLASSLALGVPANIAFAVDCLTAPNSPAPANSHWHYRTAQDRKCWHLQTDNHPFRTGSRRQPNHRDLLRRVVQVRALRTLWRSTQPSNYRNKTLKNFMLSPGMETARQELTQTFSGADALSCMQEVSQMEAKGRLDRED